MQAQSTGPILSAVFVDYDNIYLSLKRKSEEAAKRFAKDANLWLSAIASGKLITSNAKSGDDITRRIVMNRCYGNPIPRRNAHDNSTDMNSFPFIRHHFLRSGFEVIDCPPLTAQLKNSADIRMVMDVRDLLNHDTYFNEFIILSSDADFTPVLHRLRAHARRNIIFTNDNTASPYTAICDGEVREADLMTLLLEGDLAPREERELANAQAYLPSTAELQGLRKDIMSEVISTVKAAGRPVPLEALADRAVRTLGHDKTAGSQWGGAGGFRDLLNEELPRELSISSQPPYFVYDASRQVASPTPSETETRPRLTADAGRSSDPQFQSGLQQPTARQPDAYGIDQQNTRDPQQMQAHDQHRYRNEPRLDPAPRPSSQPQRQQSTPAPQPTAGQTAQQTAIQQSIARIHDASQAPPLSPPEYRTLFEQMAEEIRANNLSGMQTLDNIVQRCRQAGAEIRRDDVRFVLQVVSEPDPWFEQGASPSLFASRFRNFVVARCRSQGFALSATELDLVEAWFASSTGEQMLADEIAAPGQTAQTGLQRGKDPWWDAEEERQHRVQESQQRGAYSFENEATGTDDFPLIVRSRLRN